MKKILFQFFILTVASTISVNAQQNSPWKKFAEETSNGVILVPGCHEHSLTGGQGYSVYLRNTNDYPVTVTGSLIAKTTCGGDVNTNFKVYLQPGEAAPGSDFTAGSKTGQTSVVTAQTCTGNRYNPNPAYLNRISNVRLWNVDVNPKSTNTVAAPIINTPKQDPINNYKPAFDSISYYRNLCTITADSLNSQLYFLNAKNRILLDSLDYYRSHSYIKPNIGSKSIINKAKATTPSIIVPKVVAPKVSTEDESFTSNLKPFELDVRPGIGWDNLPIVTNNDSTITGLPLRGSSYTSNTGHPLLHLGLVAKLFNNAPVNLELNPFASYGMNVSGSGSHLTYGLGATILGALSKSLPLKLLGTANYTGRSGNTSNGAENADYKYNFLKYGGGLRYALNENTWIQPTVTFDKMNTTSAGTSDVYGPSTATVFGIESLINNKFNLNLSYSSNYLNQGLRLHLPSNVDNKGFFAVRLLYNLGLIK